MKNILYFGLLVASFTISSCLNANQYPLNMDEYVSAEFQEASATQFAELLQFEDLESIQDFSCGDGKITIEKILAMRFFPTDGEINLEIADICLAWFDQVKANEYQTSIEILHKGLQKYPHSFSLQTRLAAVLGDYAELSGSEQKQMLQKSKEIFEKLKGEVLIQPKREQFYFNNEYDYRFALYKEQYENGVAMIEHYFDLPDMGSYGYKGYYCQGVGAANYAKQLLLEHNEPLAKEYARRAVIAWAQYMSYCNDYYNAYVHYGLALGILGETKEMIRALQRGAKLIHTDLNYYEFREVLECVGQF